MPLYFICLTLVFVLTNANIRLNKTSQLEIDQTISWSVWRRTCWRSLAVQGRGGGRVRLRWSWGRGSWLHLFLPFIAFFVRWWKFLAKVSAPPGLVFSSEEDLRYTLSSVRMVYARMWDVAKFEEGTRCLSIGGCHIRNFFTHQHQPTKVWETETQWEYSLSDTQRSH